MLEGCLAAEEYKRQASLADALVVWSQVVRSGCSCLVAFLMMTGKTRSTSVTKYRSFILQASKHIITPNNLIRAVSSVLHH
jgi:hypothetical protein